MTKVLLINQETIPAYRVAVYNYMARYLRERNVELTVVSEGAPAEAGNEIQFPHAKLDKITFVGLARLCFSLRADVVIYWVRLRHLYLFPLLAFLKLTGRKAIYWGHGSDLGKGPGMAVKRALNAVEYAVSEGIILYCDQQLNRIPRRFHHKVFIANNTLCFPQYPFRAPDRNTTLAKFGIPTPTNIICIGRMQKRKRLHHLVQAFQSLNRPDVGLVFVGPDTDGVMDGISGKNIFKLGPIYGDDRLGLLSAMDIFCIPGAVGLSIVDAFYCGLPIVTEDGDESPEMMYLRPGENGFIVPRGDIPELARKLQLLIDDPVLRRNFGRAAVQEIMTRGHIDRMCAGFQAAIESVCPNRTQSELIPSPALQNRD
jgi:glycosyltransferase involved in cell wall biosynthesis